MRIRPYVFPGKPAPLTIVFLVLTTLVSLSSITAEASPPEPVKLTYDLRLGLTGNHAASNPNFYGLGAIAEPVLVFHERYAAGLRLDGTALLGFRITDDVRAGLRALGGVLFKFEWRISPYESGATWGSGKTRLILGAAGGVYRVTSVAGSVSRQIVEERQDGISGFARSGRAYGVAPQIGFQKRRVRVSALSHIIFTEYSFEPVFAIELAWELL